MKPAEAASIRVSSGITETLYVDLLDSTGAVMARASMTRDIFARVLRAAGDSWPQGSFGAASITFELWKGDRANAEPALEAIR